MNRPVHFEIHATDPAKLSKFYADVFGWQITHMPQFDYYLINTGDSDGSGINGGFVKRLGAGAAAGAPVNAFVCAGRDVGRRSCGKSDGGGSSGCAAQDGDPRRRLADLYPRSRREHRRPAPGRSERAVAKAAPHSPGWRRR